MHAQKLVQLMKTNSAALSEELVDKIRASERCRDLRLRVPESEHKQCARDVLQDLTEWLSQESDSILEQRYLTLGARRVGQGVPLWQLSWSISIARECLWNYVQQECLHEEPVEFWGGVMLLRSLNSFFDRALHFTVLGYQRAQNGESAALSFLAHERLS